MTHPLRCAAGLALLAAGCGQQAASPPARVVPVRSGSIVQLLAACTPSPGMVCTPAGQGIRLDPGPAQRLPARAAYAEGRRVLIPLRPAGRKHAERLLGSGRDRLVVLAGPRRLVASYAAARLVVVLGPRGDPRRLARTATVPAEHTQVTVGRGRPARPAFVPAGTPTGRFGPISGTLAG